MPRWPACRAVTSRRSCGISATANAAARDPPDYPPAALMLLAARQLTDEEIEASADYFSQQHAVSRVEVRESAAVPRWRVVGLVYSADPAGGTQALGNRLMEFTPDPARHEQRDDAMRYTAYVPPGSIARGRTLVSQGRPAAGRRVLYQLPWRRTARCRSHPAHWRPLGDLPAALDVCIPHGRSQRTGIAADAGADPPAGTGAAARRCGLPGVPAAVSVVPTIARRPMPAGY